MSDELKLEIVDDLPSDYYEQKIKADPQFAALVHRVWDKYPELDKRPKEAREVRPTSQPERRLTQAEIDRRWDDYPKRKGLRRFLTHAGANAAR